MKAIYDIRLIEYDEIFSFLMTSTSYRREMCMCQFERNRNPLRIVELDIDSSKWPLLRVGLREVAPCVESGF